MQFKNKVSMSLSDWRQFENDEDISLAFGHVTFISTKPNSHRHIYTKEIIEEYAPSYLGKFIISDVRNGDATSHTETQLIVGYIPANQEIQYTYDSEGYFQAGVDVVISKIYAIDAYNIFLSKDTKAVSVEQLVGFSTETEDGIDGVDEKIVIGFEGIGITILGDKFKPSVPTANIKMIKMSAEEFESEYIKYSDTKHIKKEDNVMSEILNKLNKIEEKLSKEEIMTKDNKVEIVKYAVSIGDDLWGKIYQALKEKYPKADGDWITSKYRIVGIYEEGVEKFVIVEDYDDVKKFKIMFTLTETELELADDKTEVEVEFVETNQMEMFTKEEFFTYEEALKPEEMAKETKVVEPTKEDEMACGSDKEKLAEVESKLSDAEAKIATYEVELFELKEFKTQIETVKCKEIIENTLSIAKKVVDETKYIELETESKECVYASVNDWSTKVKASLSEIAIAKMEEVKLSAREDDVVDMGMPIHVKKTKKSIYD